MQARCDELVHTAHCAPVRIFAYLDDIVICAPRVVAEQAFITVQRALESLGLSLNLAKSASWSPCGMQPPGSLLPLWRPEGLVLVGGPIEEEESQNTTEDEAQCVIGTPTGALVPAWFDASISKMKADCELLQ